MNISILGTGAVGQALATKLVSLGHKVFMGTRNIENSLNKTEPDGWGNPAVGSWIKNNAEVQLCTYKEAVQYGSELIVFAMNGNAAFDCLNAVGEDLLKGKTMIDISNPLDFSNGFPPSLTICNTDSLAEKIQIKFPELKVVKSLNTMSNLIMVNPDLIPGDHTVFVSGNDESAKFQVVTLLNSFGWRNDNIFDLGDITSARGTEMLLPVWVRLFGKLQTPLFNFNVNIAK